MTTPVSWLTSGGNKIACCIVDPAGTPDTAGAVTASPYPTVVFCGGFKSNMQGTKALALQALCSARHWPFVRFDYSGHGQSEGDFTDGNINSWLNDTLTVIDSISNPDGVVLVGSSMGAWIATLVALKRRDRVKGLITIAAAPDFTERMLSDRLDEQQIDALKSGKAVNMPSDYDDGSPYPITLQLVENSRQHCLLWQRHTLDIPVRMLHGTKDVDVPYETSIALMDALDCSDVQVTLIKDADHRLSSESDLKLLEATLVKLLT
jgi:pimeloyl-ACP methyl ester carboxylesterase